ncbi:cytochrome P450 monooxygenase [Mycena sp. CBHHK59/15]|nr:cytochrome P450 monooxygenase [Mycena sp. CBHHK59/15]
MNPGQSQSQNITTQGGIEKTLGPSIRSQAPSKTPGILTNWFSVRFVRCTPRIRPPSSNSACLSISGGCAPSAGCFKFGANSLKGEEYNAGIPRSEHYCTSYTSVPTMLTTILHYGLLLALSWLVLHGIRRVFARSSLDNIPGPPPASFLVGNLAQFHDRDGWEFHKTLEEYQGVVKIHGLLGDRQLYVFDPAALHNIVVKHQDVYEESPIFLSMSRLVFGKGILSTSGDEHRKHRKIMMPAFSTANLRGMMPVLYEVADRVRDALIAPHLGSGPKELDMYSILSRASLEFIGRAGIGYSFDSMIAGEEPQDQYAESIKNLTPAIVKLAIFLPFLPLVSRIGPAAFRSFALSLIPSKTLRHLRDVVAVMDIKAAALVRDKKAAIAREHDSDVDGEGNAKDIMSLLLKSNNTAAAGMRFTDEELAAQTSMIIQAATDSSSSALNRIIHLLTQHPEVQEKLRAEIMATKEHIGHNKLVGLPYLDAVIRETLRLYPPVTPAMSRVTTTDAVLPLSTPITGTDGKPIDSIVVAKGTAVYIAIAAANHNKAIWGQDALTFRPERWHNGRAEGVTVRMAGVYGNMMTFVGGGRSCIGFKFVQLEIKVILSVLLRSFQFSIATDRIRWKMGSPAAPSVDGEPRLPIVVERMKV